MLAAVEVLLPCFEHCHRLGSFIRAELCCGGWPSSGTGFLHPESESPVLSLPQAPLISFLIPPFNAGRNSG